ncbi:MAG: hypothetical protein M1812_007038 [Candelaria pacifica]|nr:MAG: hypothetical protein M1812_007038 [Candelaria pacifica]
MPFINVTKQIKSGWRRLRKPLKSLSHTSKEAKNTEPSEQYVEQSQEQEQPSLVISDPKTSSSRLRKLPPEIRRQIFRLALVKTTKPIIFSSYRNHPNYTETFSLGNKSLALLSPDASNQQIAEEAAEVFLQENTFLCHLCDVEKLRSYTFSAVSFLWEDARSSRPRDFYGVYREHNILDDTVGRDGPIKKEKRPTSGKDVAIGHYLRHLIVMYDVYYKTQSTTHSLSPRGGQFSAIMGMPNLKQLKLRLCLYTPAVPPTHSTGVLIDYPGTVELILPIVQAMRLEGTVITMETKRVGNGHEEMDGHPSEIVNVPEECDQRIEKWNANLVKISPSLAGSYKTRQAYYRNNLSCQSSESPNNIISVCPPKYRSSLRPQQYRRPLYSDFEYELLEAKVQDAMALLDSDIVGSLIASEAVKYFFASNTFHVKGTEAEDFLNIGFGKDRVETGLLQTSIQIIIISVQLQPGNPKNRLQIRLLHDGNLDELPLNILAELSLVAESVWRIRELAKDAKIVIKYGQQSKPELQNTHNQTHNFKMKNLFDDSDTIEEYDPLINISNYFDKPSPEESDIWTGNQPAPHHRRSVHFRGPFAMQDSPRRNVRAVRRDTGPFHRANLPTLIELQNGLRVLESEIEGLVSAVL